MPAGENTIWATFLSPIVGFLIDEDKWRRYAQSIDWEKESERLRRNDVIIPSYYSSQNSREDISILVRLRAKIQLRNTLYHRMKPGCVKPISATDGTVQVKDRQYMPAMDNNNLEGLESPVLA